MEDLALGFLEFLCESGIVDAIFEATLEGIVYKAPAGNVPVETVFESFDYIAPAEKEHFIRLGLSDRQWEPSLAHSFEGSTARASRNQTMAAPALKPC